VTVLVAVCVIVAVLLLICVLLFRRLLTELSSLATGLGSLLERLQEDEAFRNETTDRLSAWLPIPEAANRVREFLVDADGRLMDFLGRAAENLSGSVLPFLGSVFKSLPGILLSAVVVLIASYYFAIDFRGINGKLMALFPAGGQAFVRKSKEMLLETGGRFLRAYGLLMVITFAELFTAFLILGYRYAFLLAAVIALVDILPVLGTGTVLIPWAVFHLFAGNWTEGIGLLIVYGGITVARQILSPRAWGGTSAYPP
jgi:predicted PurR-regulated permease PerM